MSLGGAIQKTSRENYMPGELEFNPLAGELKRAKSCVPSARTMTGTDGSSEEQLKPLDTHPALGVPLAMGSAPGFPLDAAPGAILSPTETKLRLLEQM